MRADQFEVAEKWPKTGRVPASTCLPTQIKQTLNTIQARWGSVQIISPYRAGARVAGTGRRSYHASCRAVDFHPPRGQYQTVLSWLRGTWDGGLGTYSGRFHHIHIDTGPYVRFHNNGRGRRR